MRVVLVKSGLTVGLMIAGVLAPAGQAAADTGSAEVHCVQQVTLQGPQPAPRCFPTYAGVINYLTGGLVQLPVDLATQPDGAGPTPWDAQVRLAEESLSVHVLSTEYVGASYTGSSYTFTWSNDCTSVNVAWSSMPAGFNDVISSSRPGPSCDAIHYDNAGAGPNSPPAGDSYACPSACSSLGTMNDRTSSMRWTH